MGHDNAALASCQPDPTTEPPALPPEPLPGPGTVTISTSLLGDLQVPGSPEQAATLQALAAIQAAHCLAGIALDLRHPRLIMLLEGIARTKGSRPARQATAAVPDVLRRMLATRPGPETPLGARDRALLLGFAGALRRSELVGLSLGDAKVVPSAASAS